jgi:hypothetical protein
MSEDNIAIRGEVSISDPDGSNEQVFPMNSILRNFMRFIAKRLNSYNSAIDWRLWAPITSDGDSKSLNFEWYTYIAMEYVQYYMLNSGIWNNGLIIGTGQAVKSFEMIAMESPITSTTHPDVEFFQPRVTYIPYNTTRGCRSLNVSRLFINNSNEDVDVREMSLSISRDAPPTDPESYLMLIYDHVDMVLPANSRKNFCITLYFENYMLDNFAKSIAALIGANSLSVRSLTNQWNFLYPSNNCQLSSAGRSGIYVGSGDTPVTPEDYLLANEIPHGIGEGQLLRVPVAGPGGGVPLELMTIVNGNLTFRIMWQFRNASESNVTIREIGLVSQISFEYLVYRKVLETPVILYPGDMYKFEILFSGIYE